MAKELPYFKFNCSEWINGNITLEDLTTQGAFINICAYYWFKSGSLTLTEIKRRLKLKQPTIDALIEGNHIKVNDDLIEISFLREQFDERGHISKKNSLNGSKGGAPKGNKNAQKNNLKQAKTTNIEKEEEKEIEKEIETNYIIIGGEKIFDVLKVLEYYEVQLNGMQKENQNIDWRSLIDKWKSQHLLESFKDNMHVKNSFKRFYMSLKQPNQPQTRERVKSFNLNEI